MLKTLRGGKEPTKGSKYSAAIDLYAQDDFIMEVGETRIIPLGVCICKEEIYKYLSVNSFYDTEEKTTKILNDFMSCHYLQLEPRSSIRAKGIISCSGIIDIDYKDEIKITKELIKLFLTNVHIHFLRILSFKASVLQK